MDNEKLLSALSELALRDKIDKNQLAEMLCGLFYHLIEQKFGSKERFEVILNPQKGDLQIWCSQEVVANDDPKVNSPDCISLTKARLIEPDFEIGETVAQEIDPNSFGRRTIMAAWQHFSQQRMEVEKEKKKCHYERLIGKIISVEVHHIGLNTILVHDQNQQEMLLPKQHQIPGEHFKKGSNIKAVISSICSKRNRIQVLLSRTTPLFLQRLLETEIPEIIDGIVLIKGIARLPGTRSKVAVVSTEPRVDPVGACIGSAGRRIQAISETHLAYEPIDIVRYTEDPLTYLKRLIVPASPNKIDITQRSIVLHLPSEEIALAIGKNGQTILLASQLMGKKIEIARSQKVAALTQPVLPS